MDGRPVQAAGVVLHADSLRTLIKFHPPYTINITNLREREHGPLSWRDTVAVQNIKLSHTQILAAADERLNTDVSIGAKTHANPKSNSKDFSAGSNG